MRSRSILGLAMFTMLACRTHTVDGCLPPCAADDRAFFAECVASGSDDPCPAGNRRCCALAAACLGMLDDQMVVTTQSMCMDEVVPICDRPCTRADATTFDACVRAGTCTSGSVVHCCALAANCLGGLSDVVVTSPGCCSHDRECPTGQRCDPSRWMCGAPGSATCGDGVVTAPEQCDTHGVLTQACPYGAMSCMVCDAHCHLVAGLTSFCGDHTVDMSHGETCDPPMPDTCDPSCHPIAGPSCPNGLTDGMETDVDCGGPMCPPCPPLSRCHAPIDCVPPPPTCAGMSDCDTTGVCTLSIMGCDDANPCTDDICTPTGGCGPHPIIDRDMDSFPPTAFGCGRDCNDLDPNVRPGATERCNGRDDDCDTTIDEMCV